MAKKILIDDDEPDMVTLLTTLLEDNGYETVSAYNGIEGMEKVQSDNPDLITLDITMDKETGIKMYRKLCQAGSQIPVIMVTGISDALGTFLGRYKDTTEPAGYFEKPIDNEALLAKIKELIG